MVLARFQPTARQLEILRFVHARIAAAWPPSIREIGAHVNIANPNGVADHLSALERKGLIERGKRISRAIRVTERGKEALGVRG